jgi:hypothetical protein
LELQKVGWVVEDVLGGIDAFMREGLERDSSDLGTIGLVCWNPDCLIGAPSACLHRSDQQSLDL